MEEEPHLLGASMAVNVTILGAVYAVAEKVACVYISGERIAFF
jgi:hypothetical protein